MSNHSPRLRSASSLVRRAAARCHADRYESELWSRLKAAADEQRHDGMMLLRRGQILAAFDGCFAYFAGMDDGMEAVVESLNRGKDPRAWAKSPQAGDPCPRCGEPLLSCSPSGNGRAACDSCQTYWE